MVIPVGDLDWEEQETSLVDAPPPSEARSPHANRTRRMEKVDPMLLALTRGRSIAPSTAAKKAEPVPPKPYAKADAKPEPRKSDGPVAPRPLAVKPFMHRPFAIEAPLRRARPALPTQVLGSSNAEIPRRELFARELPPMGRLPVPTMPKRGVKAVPLPSTHLSSLPPSAETASATLPAPPPSMTGAIIIDERMFEEALGGRMHMNGASLIPSNLDFSVEEESSAPVSLKDEDLLEAVADEEVFQPTGTIDVDPSWLEDSEIIEHGDIEPESFWMRGKAR